MELRHVLLAGAAVLGAGIYFTFGLVGAPGEEPIAVRAVAEPSLPTVAHAVLPKGPESPQPEGKPDDVAALREEVALLRAEVSSLQRQMSRQVVANAGSPAATNSHTDPVARAEAERNYQAQMASVESAFRKEKTNPGWSSSTASLVQQALTSDETVRPDMRNIECRADTCRVEISDDGLGGLAKFLPMFAQQVSQSLPTITVNNIDQGNGASTMVLYLSRNSAQPGS